MCNKCLPTHLQRHVCNPSLLAQPVFNESPQSLSYPTANSTHPRVPKDTLWVLHSNSKGFVQNVHYRKINFQQVPLFLTLSTCE